MTSNAKGAPAPYVEVQAIIQARMNSTRLPGKALVDLNGQPVVRHVIDRSAAAKKVARVVVATTTSRLDDPLVDYVRSHTSAEIFRGSEDDVLERFHLAATAFPCGIVVRVTADDPLKSPEVIDEAISLLQADPSLDYVSNTITPTYPEGLDIEVFRAAALARAFTEAKLASEREHVTPYIWKNADRFKAHCFRYSEDLSSWRWTLDKPADLEFMQAVFHQFGRHSQIFPYQDVIAYLKAHPEIRDINSGTKRNEGYIKSIQKERT